jgi:hypothetical protein
MSYTELQNSPIIIDLKQAAKDTGWSVDGTYAIHESCNAGTIHLTSFTPVAGTLYNITYNVISISSGNVRCSIGANNGQTITTAGLVSDTITADGGQLTFYSNAACKIALFNIQAQIPAPDNDAQNTIVYSAKSNKWSDFRTFVPDYGFSLFTNTYLFSNGALYGQLNGGNSRNNFFGSQYQSKLKFVYNKQPVSVKTFNSIVLQANELLITTTDGISTSLGQVSELIDTDFLKDVLTDGTTIVNVYAKEGIYSAGFLRDKNEDLINGAPLKGNYITIELITTNGSTSLKLFSVAVNASLSKSGAR